MDGARGLALALQLKALAHGLLGHAVKLCSAFDVLDRTGRSSEPEILALLSVGSICGLLEHV